MDHVEAKGAAAIALNVALDAIAVFIGFIGWAFILWLPFILIAVCLILAKRQQFSFGVVVVLSVCEAVLLPIGILLYYLARGIIQRSKTLIALVALVLTAWGTHLLTHAHMQGQHGLQALQTYCQSIVFLSVAIVCLLVLAKSGEPLNGR